MPFGTDRQRPASVVRCAHSGRTRVRGAFCAYRTMAGAAAVQACRALCQSASGDLLTDPIEERR